jgi:hypothetical protein
MSDFRIRSTTGTRGCADLPEARRNRKKFASGRMAVHGEAIETRRTDNLNGRRSIVRGARRVLFIPVHWNPEGDLSRAQEVKGSDGRGRPLAWGCSPGAGGIYHPCRVMMHLLGPDRRRGSIPPETAPRRASSRLALKGDLLPSTGRNFLGQFLCQERVTLSVKMHVRRKPHFLEGRWRGIQPRRGNVAWACDPPLWHRCGVGKNSGVAGPEDGSKCRFPARIAGRAWTSANRRERRPACRLIFLWCSWRTP